jgi:hypothetical protein
MRQTAERIAKECKAADRSTISRSDFSSKKIEVLESMKRGDLKTMDVPTRIQRQGRSTEASY